MRKILPLILVVMLVVCMSVPAFASEGYVDGTYIFKESLEGIPSFITEIEFTSPAYPGTTFISFKWDAENGTVFYYDGAAHWKFPYSKGSWDSELARHVVFTNAFYDDIEGFESYMPLIFESMVEYKEYNNVSLPAIDSVWTEDSNLASCVIFKDKNSDTYHMVTGHYYATDYVHVDYNASGTPEVYCSVHNWSWYDLTDEQWVYNTGSTNDVVIRTANYDLVWTNSPIYTDSTRTEIFFPQTPPKSPTLVEIMEKAGMTGVMTEVVRMIPVGLACLIGYLALRKALAIFRRILQTA